MNKGSIADWERSVLERFEAAQKKEAERRAAAEAEVAGTSRTIALLGQDVQKALQPIEREVADSLAPLDSYTGRVHARTHADRLSATLRSLGALAALACSCRS